MEKRRREREEIRREGESKKRKRKTIETVEKKGKKGNIYVKHARKEERGKRLARVVYMIFAIAINQLHSICYSRVLALELQLNASYLPLQMENMTRSCCLYLRFVYLFCYLCLFVCLFFVFVVFTICMNVYM